MEQLKKELSQFGCKGLGTTIVMLIVGLLIIAVGVVLGKQDFEAFDPVGKAYEFQQIDAVYAMGPFAEDGNEKYYIVEDTEGMWYLMKTGEKCPVPVYGEDVSDDDLSALTGQVVKGKTASIYYNMAQALADFFQGSGVDLTAYNYEDYFGKYYLDTTDTVTNSSIVCYCLGGCLAFVGAILALAYAGRRNKIRKQADLLEQQGVLGRIYADYAAGQYQWYHKLRIVVFGHDIIDFAAGKEAFKVHSLDAVTNVFKCNMVDGEPTVTSYIALETADGTRRLIAPFTSNSHELADAVEQIKRNILGGTRW